MLRRGNSPSSTNANEAPFGVIRRTLDERTGLVVVEGELDLSTAPRLKWMLVDALEAGCTRLVVDLSKVTFMDSTALGVLVGVNRSPELEGPLAIACANENVLQVFEFSGTDGAFTIAPTLDEALAQVQRHAAGTG